jgi:thiol-disulfide isomerase/thioredoxin
MTISRRWTTALASLMLALPMTSRAQQVQAPAEAPATPAGGPTTRESIEAEFRRDLIRVEKARIERLTALAASQPRAEAARTYDDIFRFAMASGLYNETEPVAEKVIASGGLPPEVTMLAELVNLVAEANRGAYQESLNSLSAAIQIGEAAAKTVPAAKAREILPLAARLSLVNVYIQRLIQAGQYDAARRALTLIRDAAREPALKSLAEARLAQLDLVGKPAPPIAGTTVDGKPFRLADSKGDVVLVVFWASWCLPNAEEAGRLGALEAAYRGKGFRVLGVNVDTMQDGGVATAAVMPSVRRFLIDYNVRWPNLINGPGEADYAKAFGVTEIPANVLIGRDGTVLQLDLRGANLEATVAKAVGS